MLNQLTNQCLSSDYEFCGLAFEKPKRFEWSLHC